MFRGKETRHVVSILDFSTQDLLDFVHITGKIKANEEAYRGALKGKSMARLFFSDSTRTYESSGEAMERLGGRATLGFRTTQGTSVNKGESLKSTIEMYEEYGADVIVLRHPRDGSSRYAVDVAKSALIINGGDGSNEHPTQNLMDIFTIHERHGRLDHLTVVFFGDLKYGRATRLVYPMSLFEGNRFVFLSHPSVSTPDYVKDTLRQRGAEFDEIHDPEMFPALVSKADIAYGSRNQEERWPEEGTQEGDEMRRVVRNYAVLTRGVINRAKPRDGFMIMHPLPQNMWFPEIPDDVKETPHYWCRKQAKNGIYSRMGMLYSQFHNWWLDG